MNDLILTEGAYYRRGNTILQLVGLVVALSINDVSYDAYQITGTFVHGPRNDYVVLAAHEMADLENADDCP